jgi:hypothetical protein
VAAAGIMLIALPVLAGAADNWMDKAKGILGEILKEAPGQKGLSNDEIASGLKEALTVGTARVVEQLGQKGGFSDDNAIHIPLPQSFATVQSALSKIGMSSLLDDLELKLNRAAEEAVPRAKSLFMTAIMEMTLDDVIDIYKGPEDAATQYFRGKMSGPLADEMRPIVKNTLADVGALDAYENAIGRYKALPFVPDVKADLTGHVVEKGMDGIFYYMAKEEAAIRQNPAKRTTELLKRVFGN